MVLQGGPVNRWRWSDQASLVTPSAQTSCTRVQALLSMMGCPKPSMIPLVNTFRINVSAWSACLLISLLIHLIAPAKPTSNSFSYLVRNVRGQSSHELLFWICTWNRMNLFRWYSSTSLRSSIRDDRLNAGILQVQCTCACTSGPIQRLIPPSRLKGCTPKPVKNSSLKHNHVALSSLALPQSSLDDPSLVPGFGHALPVGPAFSLTPLAMPEKLGLAWPGVARNWQRVQQPLSYVLLTTRWVPWEKKAAVGT